MQTQFTLDDAILWPNGAGCTPCTSAYAEKMAERDAIKNKDEYAELAGPDGFLSMEDLSAEDYEAWNRLDYELDTMLLEGQLGKGERF